MNSFSVKPDPPMNDRSEEHTSELQSRLQLVCRLLLEKKKNLPIWYWALCCLILALEFTHIIDPNCKLLILACRTMTNETADGYCGTSTHITLPTILQL